MPVTMEALSFEGDENGRQVFRPFDKTISVDFSETSFRLLRRRRAVLHPAVVVISGEDDTLGGCNETGSSVAISSTIVRSGANHGSGNQ
jgi:hypothetical protein